MTNEFDPGADAATLTLKLIEANNLLIQWEQYGFEQAKKELERFGGLPVSGMKFSESSLMERTRRFIDTQSGIKVDPT